MRDVTPIARLTGEWDVLAAPATSTVHSVAEIRAAMTRDPAKVRWVGGALGGPDQGLVYSIAQRLGVGIDDIEYYGRAGGRRVTEALLDGRGDVGVSGYAEFQPYVDTHALNILAVAAPHRLSGIDAPTLRELGIDATMMNWRAVFAAPGSGERADRITHRIAQRDDNAANNGRSNDDRHSILAMRLDAQRAIHMAGCLGEQGVAVTRPGRAGS
jgi:putative tricarboxylic transport membrane protein